MTGTPASPAPSPASAGARRLRVAVLDHTAALGGAELALLRTVAALDPAQVEAVVVLFADGPLAGRLRDLGARVRVLPLDPEVAGTDRHAAGRPGVRTAAATVPFVGRLARLLREIDPDVVHTTSLKADLLGLPAARLARLRGLPVVWHVHDRISEDYLPGPVARVLRLAARRGPRHVVVNSRATADTLLPLPRGWTLAYPGLAPAQVAADPWSRPRPTPPVVGLVGRISPTKGQREFVDACAVLAGRYPTARFRIIGAALFAEQDYADEVRAQIEQLGLTDRIELAGWQADPVAAIDALSVLVHASPVAEPFGQVIVEGMARGVPVVATAGGGADEIATAADGAARCLVVPPRDVPALAAAVGEVLDDPSAAEARARRAWADVRREYTVAETADRLTGVWQRAARSGRG
ncbi:MAG TPA: glycosyltransferase [Cellulomonas sp.]